MMPIDHPLRIAIRETAKHRVRHRAFAIGLELTPPFNQVYPTLTVTTTEYEAVVLDFLTSVGVIDDNGLTRLTEESK